VRAIRNSFNRLVEDVQLEEREDVIAAGLAARGIAAHFTPNIRVRISDLAFDLDRRSDLQAAAIHARSSLDRFWVDVGDTHVDVAQDRLSAVMDVSAFVTVNGMGMRDETWRGVELKWDKVDGDWVISAVQSLVTIEHP